MDGKWKRSYAYRGRDVVRHGGKMRDQLKLEGVMQPAVVSVINVV